jgi:hypothetical protein
LYSDFAANARVWQLYSDFAANALRFLHDCE